MRHSTLIVIIGTALLSRAEADNSKVAPDLQTLDPGTRVQVIIQFKQKPSEANLQKAKDKGGVLVGTLDLIKATVHSLPAAALNEVAGDPNVIYISPDRTVRHTSFSGT